MFVLLSETMMGYILSPDAGTIYLPSQLQMYQSGVPCVHLKLLTGSRRVRIIVWWKVLKQFWNSLFSPHVFFLFTCPCHHFHENHRETSKRGNLLSCLRYIVDSITNYNGFHLLL